MGVESGTKRKRKMKCNNNKHLIPSISHHQEERKFSILSDNSDHPTFHVFKSKKKKKIHLILMKIAIN